jgi:hypothetical protein
MARASSSGWLLATLANGAVGVLQAGIPLANELACRPRWPGISRGDMPPS